MSAGTPFVKDNRKKAVDPATITMDMLTETIEVAASPEPLAIQPASVPTAMELPEETR